MKYSVQLGWVALMAAAVSWGCGQPAPNGPAGTQPPGAAEEAWGPAGQPEAGANVTVKVIDEKGFQEAIRAHRGKVVLVDFWATWCGPCKQLFPHTVELHKRYRDQGLVVISVSLDEPEDRQQVLNFLTAEGATFENFISAYGIGPQSFEVFGIEGSIPFYQLYDRSGQLRRTVSSAQQAIDPADIDRAVEELLKQA